MAIKKMQQNSASQDARVSSYCFPGPQSLWVTDENKRIVLAQAKVPRRPFPAQKIVGEREKSVRF